MMSSALLLEQLGNLLTAGVPLTRCLDMLEKTQTDMTARMRIYKIKQQLLAGHALHQSLKSVPEWFDHYAIKLVALGEHTGKLDTVLKTLAQHDANKQAMIRKIRGILFYPCMILVSALLMTLAMFIFIIPAFAELFRDSQQPLPWLTRCLFQFSVIFNHLFLPLLLLLGTGAALYRILHHYLRRPIPSISVSELPFVKRMMQSIYVIRFTRHLALALNAGMPILEALQSCSDLISNTAFQRQLRYLRSSVSTGASIYHAIEPLTLFPPLLKQMIKTGEESGQLDSLLVKAADHLETELQNRLARFTALLEPLIMVILGALIGGLVVGMYLPVFNLGSVL